MRFPALPPDFRPSSVADVEAIFPHLAPTLPDGRYLHWDDLRRRPPPEGLRLEQWWGAQKMARGGARVLIPGFVDSEGRPFSYCRLDAIDRATHQLDRRDAVREMVEAIGDDAVRAEYRIDQLMEEAISSSVLEGAQLTTRARAKAMIRDGRKPSAQGERMVVNNYLAMHRLLELAHLGPNQRDLALDDLLEIHAILGAGALDAPSSEGRLRTAADDVRVEDAVTGETWFVPPPASELKKRLSAMLGFANRETERPFLHPLLRAIILHFWMAYLHPFVDGNGRMARALFYWQMLRSKYDFAQYLSISSPIERSRKAYYRAFVLTETDDGDLTYFLLHQLSVLERATDDLIQHLTRRSHQLERLTLALSEARALNHRQQSVLAHLVRQAGAAVTVRGHASSHDVTYLTARKDLQDLEGRGLLRRNRVGKTDRYLPTERVQKRLTAASARRA
ncbi:MAG TPA: Fic family protein [Polyangiaceae bacterium]|nr:Fic family protein [Polyangiaceae bacterium]